MIAEAFATLALATSRAPAAPAAGAYLGNLSIPKLAVRESIFESTSGRNLARGVGHYSWTSLPGGSRGIGIAGHRVTYGAPFRHLNRLRKNDRILIRTAKGRTFRYRVYAMRVVRPRDVWVLGGRRARRLVLTTCHPAGTARQRLVVFAKPVKTFAKPAATLVERRGR